MTRQSGRLSVAPGTARLAAVVWTALLVVAAIVPGHHLELPGGSDLWMHAAGYGVHAALTFLAIRHRGSIRRAMVVALVAASALGAATEALQGVVPRRQPSLADGAADVVGATLGVAAMWTLVACGRLDTRGA